MTLKSQYNVALKNTLWAVSVVSPVAPVAENCSRVAFSWILSMTTNQNWNTLWKIGGFLKWWYPTTIGFPTKNDHFGVWNGGYHHLRKHPYLEDKSLCKLQPSWGKLYCWAIITVTTRWFKVTFYPLFGGHLTIYKGHLTIPKRLYFMCSKSIQL